MYQRQLSFWEAVSKAIGENYCNFSGRASRSEFWWWYLFQCLVPIVWTIAWLIIGLGAQTILGEDLGDIIVVLTAPAGYIIATLVLLLPSLGVTVRRLHDIGKCGWWVLLGLIPVIGAIILLVWYCQESQPRSNQYGPVPNIE